MTMLGERVVRAGTGQLLTAAARIAGRAHDELAAVAEAMLAEPRPGDGRARGGRSGLNHDGTPLQVCITSSRRGLASRVLADPAAALGVAHERYAESLGALDRVVALTGTAALRPLCDATLGALVPSEPAAIDASFPDGVFWLAASAGRPGCALYVDARTNQLGTAQQRIARFLDAIVPAPAEAHAVLAAIADDGLPLCAGIEGSAPGDARAKLYWRMSRPVAIDAWGIERFADRRIAAFLHAALGNRAMSLTGVVMNAGFRVATGAFADAKIDVCGCRSCLHRSLAEWQLLIDAVCRDFALAPLDIRAAEGVADVSYVGFGIDEDDRPRLNLYLKVKA